MPLQFGKNTRIKFVYGDLNIQVDGVQDFVMALDTMVRKSMNMVPVFDEFQSVWFESIDHNFASGGGPVDWPALSPAYASRKSQAYPGQPIMRASDRLYESLTSQTGDTIWHVGPKSLQFGTRVPYFEFHQEGTGKMPARPVLTLSDQAARELVKLVERYIIMAGR